MPGPTGNRMPTLVPRYLRRGLQERIDKCGEVITPLDEAEVASEIAGPERERVDSITVCLFNSFLNDEHERRVAAALERSRVGYYTLSADLAPIMVSTNGPLPRWPTPM